MSATPITDLPTVKRKIPVPFFSQVGANTGLGLSSDMITFKFKITKVEAHFTDDSASQMQVWAFVSGNRNVTTAAPMPDNKILGFYAPTPYLIGSGEIVSVDVDVTPAENEQFLKIYFFNQNAYAVYGYAIITIETSEEILPSEQPSAVFKDESQYSVEDWANIVNRRGEAINAQVLDGLSGSPRWLDIGRAENEKGEGYTKQDWVGFAAPLAIMTNYFTPSMHNDDFIPALQRWFNDANQLMGLYSIAEMVGDITGLGQLHFTKYLVERDESTWKIGSQMGKVNEITFNQSMDLYTRYSANWYFRAVKPSVQDIVNFRVKDKIDDKRFFDELGWQGYSDEYIQLIWDSHFIAPDFETMKRAINRELIPDDQIEFYLKLVDLDPSYNPNVWIPLLDEIPPYQELVNERVKEVITQEEFEKGLKAWGFKGDWALRIWNAHFTPPTYEDFLTAMRRKETVTIPRADGTTFNHTFGEDTARDLDVIHELNTLVDYDPRYQTFFDTRLYNDPTPRMSMWAFETGSIQEETLRDIVHRYGYYPDDETWFGDMLVHFQERPWINRYLTTLQTAYIADAITADELRTRVLAIPRNIEIAEWMIRIADVRKEIKGTGTSAGAVKLLGVGELKSAYLLNKISESDFNTELQLRGYSVNDIQILLDLMNTQKEMQDSGGKKIGLTTTELFDAYKYSLIDVDSLRTELMLRGMTLDDANTLIEIKNRKWGVGET